ncbi:hypothetical protein GCM10023311_12910 [Flaviramulus aquimarinus]|uniref:Alpha-L-glutamate ligase-related protein ATP-grasp domain-containing protein n=1 Tax=Flaviramulus aquimarinus TaxID=1170456 RepID=A0ABP9EZP8_9FLAO
MRNFDNIGRLKVFIKNPQKKGFFKMFKECCKLLIIKKEIPFYYFKYLYCKGVTNYLDYLSTKEVVAIGNSKILHKPEYKDLLENKLLFTLFSEKCSINTPRLISYNLGNTFSFGNKSEIISSRKALITFFESVFASTKIDAIFFRPPSEYGGKGCFKLSKNNLVAEIEAIYESLIRGCFVHTEVVKQHESINAIYDKSLNTIRVISLITPENTIEIICAFMRFGVGESVVDNASSGGFYVGIDLDRGTLNTSGHYMLEYGGGNVYEHPNSGYKFEGFKIPYFKEACKEVKKTVKIIPDRFIGWDVAITPNGPTIVEANSGPHIFLSDYAYGGLLKNQHIKNLIKELKTVN